MYTVKSYWNIFVYIGYVYCYFFSKVEFKDSEEKYIIPDDDLLEEKPKPILSDKKLNSNDSRNAGSSKSSGVIKRENSNRRDADFKKEDKDDDEMESEMEDQSQKEFFGGLEGIIYMWINK